MISGEGAKKKWKGLRDSYGKHVRSLKTTTGQAAKNLSRYKTWPWAQQMAFLKPYIEYAQTESNVSSIDVEIEDDEGSSFIEPDKDDFPQSNIQEDGRNSDTDNALTNERKKRKISSVASVASNADKVISFLKNRVPKEDDEIDLIFQSFSKTVKKFSPQRKAVVKAKIAQYISQEELAHLREIDQNPSSAGSSVSRQSWPSYDLSDGSNYSTDTFSGREPSVPQEIRLLDISRNVVAGPNSTTQAMGQTRECYSSLVSEPEAGIDLVPSSYCHESNINF